MSDTPANIKQIFTSFHNVNQIFENQNWVKTATSEDIKTAFKLGHFVERTLTKMHEKDTTRQFFKSLKLWGDKNQFYEPEFYSKICDHLLSKFFKCRSVNENVIDIAIRMYTSLYPKQRLQALLKDLIMTSASYDAIFQFCVTNKSVINTTHLRHELILNDWLRDFQNGHKDLIVSQITESLSSFKVENSLPILLGILALNVKNPVTTLILEKVLEKMPDRSILSKNFWLAMIKNVDFSCLCQVCTNYFDFLESLCNFLIYIGSMMEKTDSDWLSNSNISLCPEITYSELEMLFICLCKNLIIKNYVIDRLKEAEECTDSVIWNEIKTKC